VSLQLHGRDGLGLKCPATVRKAKTAGGRIAPKDEDDKENADNGGRSSRSKRSMKSTALKAADDEDLDVFDPENDQQFQQPPSKAAKVASKGKASTKGEDKSSDDANSIAERERELSKLKVHSFRLCVHHASRIQRILSCSFPQIVDNCHR
jgi:hypothetical protein